MDEIANTTRIATLTSATWRRSPSGIHPKSVVSAPNGTTANAAKAQVAAMIGASAKSNASAARGRSSSLNISLMMSASGWRRPFRTTRYQPLRPDEIRTHPLLQKRRHFPLDVDHDRCRVEQHEEDEEREADLADKQRG